MTDSLHSHEKKPRIGPKPDGRAGFRGQCAAHRSDAYDTLQVHVAAQLQTSPHRQPARLPALRFWQPHVHTGPGQDPHAHTFALVDMRRSFVLVDMMSTTWSVASEAPAGIV